MDYGCKPLTQDLSKLDMPRHLRTIRHLWEEAIYAPAHCFFSGIIDSNWVDGLASARGKLAGKFTNGRFTYVTSHGGASPFANGNEYGNGRAYPHCHRYQYADGFAHSERNADDDTYAGYGDGHSYGNGRACH
jgi:hypothetical protein